MEVLRGRKGPERVKWGRENRNRTGGFLGTPSTLLQNFSHLASGGGGPLGWSLLALQFLA